ncbi:MAG: hypothetical protein ACYC9K_00990 [Sulfuricaulis sp.]
MKAIHYLLGSLVLASCGQSVPAFEVRNVNPPVVVGDLPDARLTPGKTDPRVTQDNIDTTICNHKGWMKTQSIRPPVSYTNRLKAQQIEQYGFADKSLKSYEEDHLISRELGGCLDCAENLWPEHYAGDWGAKKKDRIEDHAAIMVCRHEMLLKKAQCEISSNWILMYRKYLMADNTAHQIGDCQ